jgi:hypothetical protein
MALSIKIPTFQRFLILIYDNDAKHLTNSGPQSPNTYSLIINANTDVIGNNCTHLQDSQCPYKVTLRRVLVAIVAVLK